MGRVLRERSREGILLQGRTDMSSPVLEEGEAGRAAGGLHMHDVQSSM